MLGLGQFAELLTKFESRAPNVYPRQCKHVRHRNGQCTLCADHCPAGAITLREPQVDGEKCVGCGICSNVCPAGVFEAANPTNAGLLERIEEIGKAASAIRFACPKIKGDAEGIIRITCLGRLDVSILVDTIARGIRQIELVDGACRDCPNGMAHTIVAQAVAEALQLIEAFGITARLAFVAALPSASVAAKQPVTADPVSRRTFFNRLVKETTRAAAATTASVLDGSTTSGTAPVRGALPTRVPGARQLLLDGLKRLGQPVLPEARVELKSFGTFGITSACSGCRMCAFFCPTGALRQVDRDGKVSLAFSSAYCTNCGLCRDICYCQSVNVDSHIDLAKVVSVAVDVIEVSSLALTSDEKIERLLQALQAPQPRQSSLRGE